MPSTPHKKDRLTFFVIILSPCIEWDGAFLRQLWENMKALLHSIPEKVWSFAKPPRDPPPRLAQKIYPHFF